ncbi:MAG: SPASM domain-containing protein [bacterium]|nr:SPASM domain-containing protein [bacterium]
MEHNGDIYPCDFFVRENLKLGNIMDISWEEVLAAPLYKDFRIQKSRFNPACMTCNCRDLCMGDCLKNRIYGNSNARNISWLCTGWQQLIGHSRDKLQDLADGIRGSQIRADQKVLRSKAGRRRFGPGTGRNQPCPCGSGRKYKKCCDR